MSAAQPRVPLTPRSQFLRSTRNGDATRRSVLQPERPGRPLKLSILMPVYNEERTLSAAVDGVLARDYPVEVELCVIDDGSTDGTPEILESIRDSRLMVHRHPRNLGKGAAVTSAAAAATGTYMVPFDADLEYSATDLPRMLAPIMTGRCDVVFGTRMFGVNTSYQSFHQAMGNRALTLAANVLFNTFLSDIHSCLKMMPLSLFRALNLRERGFGLDAELAARILQLGIRPFEVPVSYRSRSFADGKKITWRDGLHCLGVLARVRRGQPAALVTPLDWPDLIDTTPLVTDGMLDLPHTDYEAQSAAATAP
jgi:glycosyltransferase involved in cell wall biosynthesis